MNFHEGEKAKPFNPWGDSRPMRLFKEAKKREQITNAVKNFPKEIIQYNQEISEDFIQKGLGVSQSVVGEWDKSWRHDGSPCLIVRVAPALWERGIKVPRVFSGFRVFLIKDSSSD